MNLLYMLQYMKWNEGVKLPVKIYYDNIETLLADLEEFGLKKGDYDIYQFVGKKLSPVDILTAYTEEIGGYEEIKT